MCHGGIQRCRKTHGLARARKLRHNPPDGGNETHVQHAVGFVKDQGVYCLQVEHSAIQQIFKTSGGGHNHARPAAQRLQLCALRISADQERRRWNFISAQLLELSVDLHGQFARGNQYQRLDSLCRLGQQFFNDWDQKGQGFAGARLGGGKNIFTQHGGRNGRFLYLGWVDELCRG